MSYIKRLKQKLKMSDNNAKPSLQPPIRQPAAPAANAATMEDNIAIRKTKSVKFGLENVRKVEVICEFDKNLPVENRMNMGDNQRYTLRSKTS